MNVGHPSHWPASGSSRHRGSPPRDSLTRSYARCAHAPNASRAALDLPLGVPCSDIPRSAAANSRHDKRAVPMAARPEAANPHGTRRHPACSRDSRLRVSRAPQRQATSADANDAGIGGNLPFHGLNNPAGVSSTSTSECSTWNLVSRCCTSPPEALFLGAVEAPPKRVPPFRQSRARRCKQRGSLKLSTHILSPHGGCVAETNAPAGNSRAHSEWELRLCFT